ncbi:MAG TPA: transposase, partial [Candidatus Dormibacteraeota bacterium]|nr:transposase [Candidatus Dormibacteraeota bacterium]
MSEDHDLISAHQTGEQPLVEPLAVGPVPVDTYAGRIDVEWDPHAAVTPLGQLPFFIEYLKQAGLFDGWVAGCPIRYTSPNAPSKRDLLGTVLLSVLSGHWRYAHITALRADPVSPSLLGMKRVLSEDAVRRGLAKIDPEAGAAWLQENLDYVTRPLLREPWILDVDTTVKPLFGHQEGAVIGYNPAKPGRPSHSYHSYLIANLRLVLDVEVHDGNQTASKHGSPGPTGPVTSTGRLGRDCRPSLLRGDTGWGNEAVMREAEQRNLPYLFRIRLTANVRRAIERAANGPWTDAGRGWQGQSIQLRLDGWGRQRRVVLLRRKLEGAFAISEPDANGQQLLSFATVDARKQV